LWLPKQTVFFFKEVLKFGKHVWQSVWQAMFGMFGKQCLACLACLASKQVWQSSFKAKEIYE
jgi:hypothetical protein